MKKILFLVLALAVVLVVWNREMLYLRDPLATVTRDGVKQTGLQIYINYNNDVLLESDKAPMYLTLIQHGQHLGTPLGLKCLHYVACRTDAAASTLLQAGPGTHIDAMSSKTVSFHDADNSVWVVILH